MADQGDFSMAEQKSREWSPDRMEIRAPSLESLQEERAVSEAINIDFILDIPLHLSVELGRTKILINDLLQLGKGSVIELNRVVGDPVEILINEKPIARGEVVVVNEKFGVRLTDIISPTERVEQLR
ncbi:MAG: flagellar motor switch protein FliN [Candidatus Tectomicrobia bacterium]|uniref:Flagellar motor switch protein FliN n=1 Tax=Tectimicrobiota bacterium TaxID=2528274 RepID=A0A932FXK4_UNCTE|nr:flagellar motor switch protein FliN [Candidatus Tectomicrobia bacterium]